MNQMVDRYEKMQWEYIFLSFSDHFYDQKQDGGQGALLCHLVKYRGERKSDITWWLLFKKSISQVVNCSFGYGSLITLLSLEYLMT